MPDDGSSPFRRKSARRCGKNFKACPLRNGEPIDVNFVASTVVSKAGQGLTTRNDGPSKQPSLRVEPLVNETYQTYSAERRCVSPSFLLCHRDKGRMTASIMSPRISGRLKCDLTEGKTSHRIAHFQQ